MPFPPQTAVPEEVVTERLLLRQWRGRGYATEAGRVALRVARENIGADRVISLIRPGNEPSVAVAVNLGGVLDSTVEFRGGPMLVYPYPSRP
jgi:RimJ/RimL family protein N-acetyltransferase